MVVKCVFGGTPVERIVGLHERRNPELIQMLATLSPSATRPEDLCPRKCTN